MTHKLCDQELASDFAHHMAEGMDIETLFVFAVDTLREKYSQLTQDELMGMVREFAPFMIEELGDD
jgi:hypothetical protein